MAEEKRPPMENRRASRLSVLALVLAIIALILAIVLPMQIQVGPQGPQGPQGLQGIQGPKGDPGGLVWGAPIEYGPYTLDIGTAGDYFSIESLNPGDRVQFTFTVSGSDVKYWVEDPWYNHILTGRLGNAVSEGAGSFIAASSGPYLLHFSSTGLITPSVLAINYTVYPTYTTAI
jgi:hypothetical protein